MGKKVKQVTSDLTNIKY